MHPNGAFMQRGNTNALNEEIMYKWLYEIYNISKWTQIREDESDLYPHTMVRDGYEALKLYLEGLGFRSIGRILGFSHVAVYYWIRAFGEKVVSLGESEDASIVEIDEMHSYIGQKKLLLDMDCC